MAYTKPLPGWGGAGKRRSDQGRDFQGQAGQHVVAIGNAKVVYVNMNSTGFGNYIVYQLTSGPSQGKKIYVGHASALVRQGDTVKQGQPIATLVSPSLGNANHLSGWVEIGIAGADNNPVVKGKGGKGGGEKFDALLKGAKDPTETTAPVAPVSPVQNQDGTTDTVSSVGQDVSGQLSSAIGDIPQVGDAPLASTPLAGDYVDTSVQPKSVGQTWQLIASQGNVSPDTIRLAQLANSGDNAASGQ